MTRSLQGQIDRLVRELNQHVEQAVTDERHRIAAYIQRRAPEIGASAYQLAEDVELGLHEEEG